MLSIEKEFWGANPDGFRLAGIDEAGRGPLAGPVVAAAVVMSRDLAEHLKEGSLKLLTDSKKLTESQREEFYSILMSNEDVDVGVGMSEAEEIDSVNILRATHLAMGRAALSLKGGVPDFVLVDGLPVRGLPCDSKAIVKGDAKSFLIAAASVVAKVTRDHILLELDKKYPDYGFAKHKGYGTAEHLKAIEKFGPCPEHRKTFAPVAQYYQSLLF